MCLNLGKNSKNKTKKKHFGSENSVNRFVISAEKVAGMIKSVNYGIMITHIRNIIRIFAEQFIL